MSAEGSGPKVLLNYKTVIVLFLAVILNLIVCALIWRLDFFVHGDLYHYGLNYSHAWGDTYWNLTAMLWIFLFVATSLVAVSVVPHYMHSRKATRFTTWTGFVLPILALIFEGVSIFYLYQKNSMVWNTLSDYGLLYDANWANAYNLMSIPALVLMVITLVALFIPAARAVEHEIKM
jgi:hypothetical protein